MHLVQLTKAKLKRVTSLNATYVKAQRSFLAAGQPFHAYLAPKRTTSSGTCYACPSIWKTEGLLVQCVTTVGESGSLIIDVCIPVKVLFLQHCFAMHADNLDTVGMISNGSWDVTLGKLVAPADELRPLLDKDEARADVPAAGAAVVDNDDDALGHDASEIPDDADVADDPHMLREEIKLAATCMSKAAQEDDVFAGLQLTAALEQIIDASFSVEAPIEVEAPAAPVPAPVSSVVVECLKTWLVQVKLGFAILQQCNTEPHTGGRLSLVIVKSMGLARVSLVNWLATKNMTGQIVDYNFSEPHGGVKCSMSGRVGYGWRDLLTRTGRTRRHGSLHAEGSWPSAAQAVRSDDSDVSNVGDVGGCESKRRQGRNAHVSMHAVQQDS